MATANESYAIIGGEGFLGHNLVLSLNERHPNAPVLSIDLGQRFEPTPSSSTSSVAAWTFQKADLTSFDEISSALAKYNVTTVFHVASPWLAAPPEVAEKVNVVGTQTVVDACVKTGVKKLVYTSSASVIYNGEALFGADERMPFASPPMDAYNDTKARAEKIALDANGKGGLLTCAIRPSGIFGPGDRQAAPGFANVLKNGQTKWQIGDNTNLFDWTYIDNVVYAHILAAARLGSSVPATEFLTSHPVVTKSLPSRPLPTSLYRPFPDAEEKTEVENFDEKTVSAAGIAVGDAPIDPPIPARRTQFNQFAYVVHSETVETDQIPVAGQAFIITNGEPIPFWDLPRAFWYATEQHVAPYVVALPKPIGLVFAALAEKFSLLMGRTPGLTAPKVKLSCADRWFDIEKARLLLGYEPIISMDEGVRRMAEWWLSEGYKLGAKTG